MLGGGTQRMRSKELEPGFWGGAQIAGELGEGLKGLGGSREMGRLEDLEALVIVAWALEY